ncbi:MAG: hypothetical protein ACW981_12150 [Candidatus Hodarchaeales archaeon]
MRIKEIINNQLFLSCLLLSSFLVISWLTIEYLFGFSRYNVDGPGGEFLPFFRLSILMLILLYPFFNFFLIFNVRIIEKISEQPAILEIIGKKAIFKILIWMCFWPGSYLVFGWFLGTIPSLLDPAISIPHNVTIAYWLMFLILGRLGDPIPYIILKMWIIKPLTLENVLLYSINSAKRFFFDIIVIYLAFVIQLIAFFVPLGPVIVLLDIPEISTNFGFIRTIPFILWPILFLLGYLTALFLRTVFQTNNIRIFDGLYPRIISQ